MLEERLPFPPESARRDVNRLIALREARVVSAQAFHLGNLILQDYGVATDKVTTSGEKIRMTPQVKLNDRGTMLLHIEGWYKGGLSDFCGEVAVFATVDTEEYSSTTPLFSIQAGQSLDLDGAREAATQLGVLRELLSEQGHTNRHHYSDRLR
ncbi:MAG TPA: hypothetical protein VJC10_00815 [Patescibacteria group bacterium]|nr:hypothetical protein [Patescibacteria group bacterium]